ncbi:MAG: Rrf2 family transcriptional regulator [Lachnospiraceae bacterium]|nr:Rrf2 family transcriptional regulator [Lachnospiraceae bacterium]
MKISTKGRYALHMLIDLAEHPNNGYISLNEIAKRQGISKKYLEQIIPILNRSDILRTERGAQGGYMLARDPSKITVLDILLLTEGSLAPVDCVGQNSAACERSSECATLPIWKGLADVINGYLAGISLQDIVDRQRALYGGDYVI